MSTVTFARLVEVMRITAEEALEGFMFFIAKREGKAERYPDYKAARLEATRRLQQLATLETAYGTRKVDAWLDGQVNEAERIITEREAGVEREAAHARRD